jgi:uncharacterized RDD family membrane protein YckC
MGDSVGSRGRDGAPETRIGGRRSFTVNPDGQLPVRSADGVEVSLTIAGVGGRSFAFVIDWHLRLALALVWLIGSSFLMSWLPSGLLAAWATWFEDPAMAWISVVAVPAAALYFLYHPVLEVLMRGRTPGKRMAGVRIVTQEGQTPGMAPLLIRNVFRLVDSLPLFYVVGLVTVALTRQQVRLGDLAAGTVLVYDSLSRGAPIQDLPLSAAAGPAQGELELVHELLGRWSSLDGEARRRLARQVLEPHGVSVPEDLTGTDLDRDLRRQLEGLVHGR